MFDRLSPEARRVLHLSADAAQELRHDWIGTEHLLLGLLRLEQDTGPLFDTQPLADLDFVRTEVVRICGPAVSEEPLGHIPFTPRTKTVFDITERHCRSLEEGRIEPRHLLYGILTDGGGVAVHVLRDLGSDLAALTAQAAV